MEAGYAASPPLSVTPHPCPCLPDTFPPSGGGIGSLTTPLGQEEDPCYSFLGEEKLMDDKSHAGLEVKNLDSYVNTSGTSQTQQ